MFRLKCKLEVDYMLAFKTHHYIPFVAHNAFLSRLKETIFLHEFEGIEYSSGLEPGQEDPWESTSSDALDDFKVLELDLVCPLLSPDGLDFKQFVLEDFDGLASLEIVVFQHVRPAWSLPVHDARRVEILIA